MNLKRPWSFRSASYPNSQWWGGGGRRKSKQAFFLVKMSKMLFLMPVCVALSKAVQMTNIKTNSKTTCLVITLNFLHWQYFAIREKRAKKTNEVCNGLKFRIK